MRTTLATLLALFLLCAAPGRAEAEPPINQDAAQKQHQASGVKPEARKRSPEKARAVVLLAAAEKKKPATATPAAVTPPPAVDAAPRSWKRTYGWVGLGAGCALLATGAILGVLAQDKADEYNDEASAGTLYRDLKEIESEGDTLQAAQIATLIAGGVLFSAGAVLVFLDRRSQGEEPAAARVAVTPYVGKGSYGLAGQIQF